MLRILHRDQFELEKLLLKHDQEILNRCITIDESEKVKIHGNPISLMKKASGDAEDSHSDGEERKSPRQSRSRHLLHQSSLSRNLPVLFSDAYFEAKLQQQRLRMSMRRNILRRTLSEDL